MPAEAAGFPADVQAWLATGTFTDVPVDANARWLELIGATTGDASTATLDGALRGFSAVWGQLPGIDDVPADTLTDDEREVHQYDAIDVLVAKSDELTDEQRSEARRLLGLGNATAIEQVVVPAASPANPPTTDTAPAVSAAGLQAGFTGAGSRSLRTPREEDIQAVRDALTLYGGLMSVPEISFGVQDGVDPPDARAADTGTLTLSAAARQALGLPAVEGSTCVISLFPQLERLAALYPGFHKFAMSHEAFHCVQQALNPDNYFSSFFKEGTAQYAALIARPEFVDRWWLRYLKERSVYSLFDESYGTAGWYFWMEAQVGRGEMFARIESILRSQPEGQEADASARDLSGNDPSVWIDWAASIVREPSWGAAWAPTGNGIPADGKRVPTVREVAPGSPTVVTVPAGANTVTDARFSGGEIVDFAAAGSNRLRLQPAGTDRSMATLTTQRLCLIERCLCPDGSPPPGGEGELVPGMTGALIATNGDHVSAGLFGMRISRLADLCPEAPPADSSPQGRFKAVISNETLPTSDIDLPVAVCVETTTDFGDTLEVYAADLDIAPGATNEQVIRAWSQYDGARAFLVATLVEGSSDDFAVQWNDVVNEGFTGPNQLSNENNGELILAFVDGVWTGRFLTGVVDPRNIGPDGPPPGVMSIPMEGVFQCG